MADPSQNDLSRIPIGILLVIALGGVGDLVLDRPTSFWSFHVLFELTMLVFALGAAAYLWLRWQRSHDSLSRTEEQLESRARERDLWQGRAQRILRGLGEEIDRQLREWQLTPVERETALLMLKGLGHKEIATLQGKSERTVRQHAVSVYRKSGLAGRAELSAFFLEDLMLPQSEPDPGACPSEDLVDASTG